MNKFNPLFIALLLTTLSACKAKPEKMIGDDKDAHGCIPSAGYQWCGKENKCVRSWELFEEKSLNKTQEAFSEYCN